MQVRLCSDALETSTQHSVFSMYPEHSVLVNYLVTVRSN